MIDFELSEQQKLLKDQAHRFAIEEVRPVAWEVDKNPDPDCWPDELYRKASDLGYTKILIPEEYGGPGLGLLDLVVIMEEIGWGDVGVAVTLGTTAFCIAPIAAAGTDYQKEKFLRPFVEGKTDGYTQMACPGTEPTGGTEIFCPLDDPKTGHRTLGVKDGNEWVINGSKMMICAAGKSWLYVMTARTDPLGPNVKSTTAFLVPYDTPGMVFGRVENKTGNRTVRNQEIFFENVRVPEENVLGPLGRAIESVYEPNPTFPSSSHCYVAAATVGMARAAYEEAFNFAKERVVWGKPIRQHDLIARRLVNMRLEIQAMRLITWNMAWALEHMDQPELSEGLAFLGGEAPKYYTAEHIVDICQSAINITGAVGFTKDHILEKFYRDAVVLPIAGQTAEYHQIVLARKL